MVFIIGVYVCFVINAVWLLVCYCFGCLFYFRLLVYGFFGCLYFGVFCVCVWIVWFGLWLCLPVYLPVYCCVLAWVCWFWFDTYCLVCWFTSCLVCCLFIWLLVYWMFHFTLDFVSFVFSAAVLLYVFDCFKLFCYVCGDVVVCVWWWFGMLVLAFGLFVCSPVVI